MLGLDNRRLVPLRIVAFFLFIAAAVAGSSTGVDAPDLGSPIHSALRILLASLLATIGYTGYSILSGK